MQNRPIGADTEMNSLRRAYRKKYIIRFLSKMFIPESRTPKLHNKHTQYQITHNDPHNP